MNGNRQGNRGVMPPPPSAAEFLAAEPSQSAPVEAQSEVGEVLPQEPIAVIATRKGFFGGKRLDTGDKFFIPSMEQFGLWMKLADAKAEKERVKKLELEKKAKKLAGK